MRQLSLRLCVLFVLLFTGASALMAQQLVPGDIAIIGVHTNSPNSFIVVALKDVQPGQVITFTDNAWISASNNFQTAEGYLEWTLTSGLSAGATATFTYSSSWSVATGSLNPGGTFAFNNSGDQIIAFAGDWANRPTTGSDTKFLWAFSMCNFGYLPVSPNFSSDCPSVLANYSTALNTSSSPFRNAFFANGLTQVTQLTLSGTKTNFATAFFDKYKFRKTTSIEAFPAYTFTVRTDADTANHLVFVNFPTSGYPNTNLNSFTVEARNSSEQVVTNFFGDLILGKQSGPGDLGWANTAGTTNGVFTFDLLTLTAAGTYVLNANIAGLTTGLSPEINILQPSITLTAPNGGEVWAPGTTQQITWTAEGVNSPQLEYKYDNGEWIFINEVWESNSYSWEIPSTPSTQCVVRVSSQSDPSVYDTSNAYFTIGTGTSNPSITLTAPNGGETWTAGTTQNITWTSTDISLVGIGYTPDNGATWFTIANNVQASLGTYAWQVPSINSSEVKIDIWDEGTGINDMSNAVFSILQGTFITVTSPNGGENITGNTVHNITWNSNNVSQVSLQYKHSNGSWNTIASGLQASPGTYAWSVPNTAASTYLVKVFDRNNGATFDTSDAYFTVTTNTAYVSITSPMGGEQWQQGTEHNITWYTTGVANVKLEYTTSGGDPYTTIVESVPASPASYTWTVPATLGTKCRVRVSEAGNPALAMASPSYFTIYNQPAITISSPSGGENWVMGTTKNIAWSSIGASQNVKIQFSDNGGLNWYDIASQTENDGYHSWAIPSEPFGDIVIRVLDFDNPLLGDTTNVLHVVSQPGTVALLTPNGGETIAPLQQYNITWTNSAGVTNVRLDYSTNGGSWWSPIVASTPASNGSYTWTVPDISSATCLVKVSDFGDANNVYDQSDAYFTIGNVTPTLTLNYPNGGESWMAGTVQTISWSSTGISTVKIKLWDNAIETTIATVQASQGSYQWMIPSNTYPGSGYLIHIMSTDSLYHDYSNNMFSITAPPSITVTSPNGGENWVAGSSHTITWTSNGVSTVSLLYSTNNGNTWNPIVSNIQAALMNYNWTLPADVSSNCLVQIIDPMMGYSDVSNNVFTISAPAQDNVISLNGTTDYIEVPDNALWDLTGSWSIGLWVKFNSVSGNPMLLAHESNGSYGGFELYYDAAAGALKFNANNTLTLFYIPCTLQTNTWYNIVISANETMGTMSAFINGTNAANGEYGSVGNVTGILRIGGYCCAGAGFVNGSMDDVSFWNTPLTENMVLAYYQQPNLSGSESGLVAYWNMDVTGQGQNVTVPNLTGSKTSGIDGITRGTVSTPVFQPQNVQASLTLTAPNGGENWTAGTTQNITWTATDVEFLEVFYSTNNGANWTYIDDHADATTGTLSWTVPAENSTNCLVKVVEFGNPALADSSDAVFTITPAATPTLIFLETMGTVAATTTIAVHEANNGFDNDAYTMTSGDAAMPGDIRITTPSTGYPGASGGANVWLTTVNNQYGFAIEGINAAGFSSITLNYGYYKSTATTHATFQVDFWNGTQWVTLANSSAALFNEADNAAMGWYAAKTLTLPVAAQINGLKIRFVKSGTIGIRIDDVKLDGMPVSESLTLTNPPSGGAVWEKGSTQNITWSSSGISNVKIKWATYSTDETIATVAANPAVYAWTIPTEIYSGLYMMYLMTPDSSLVTPSYYVTITDPVVASLSSIQPNTATQGESKFCDIYGQNTHFISGGTQIWLSDGTTNISGTGVNVENETYAQCTFDFSGGQPAGVYNLHVYTGTDGDLVLNNAFTLNAASVGSIAVTSPNGGENWTAGTQQNITWTSTGVSNVSLYYSTNFGYNWIIIDDYVQASASPYAWTVPNENSDGCLVKIVDNGNPSVRDSSNSAFVIVPAATASIESIQPNSGTQGQTVSCDIWGINTNFVAGQTQIWLSQGANNISGTSVNVEQSNYVQCQFVIPAGQPIGVYNLNVYTAIDGTVTKYDAFTINASTTATLQLTSPNGGENWTGGTSQNITWNSSNVNYVDLYYSTNSGIDWIFINDGIPAASGSYSWTVPSISSTNCLVKILNTNDNTLKDSSNAVFTIYTPASPEIISVTPSSGTQNQTYNLTIQSYGMNYGTNDTCWLSGDAWIAPNYVDAINSNQLVANFTFTTSHPAGSYQLIVNNPTDGTYVKPNAFTLNAASVGSIAVTSPNGGENWTAGTQQNITWTSTGVSNVSLYYSTNFGYNWIIIDDYVQASASPYAWTVPNENSDGCLVKIVDNGNPSVRDSSNSAFVIVPAATASIESIQPNSGTQGQTVSCDIWGINTNFVAGQTQIWLSQGTNNISGTSVNVEQSNYVQCQFVIPAGQPTGVYNLNVYTAIDGTVTKYDAFTVNASGTPSITLTNPVGGESWQAGTTHNITWTASNLSTIKIKMNDGTTDYTIASGVQALLGTYQWAIPTGTTPGSYMIYLMSPDSTVFGGFVSISITAPSAVSNSVLLNGTNDGISTNSPIITGSGDFTISLWVKTNNGNEYVLGNYWDDNPNGLLFYIRNNVLTFFSGGSYISAMSPVANGNWRHIALVREQGVLKFYLDGNLDATSQNSSSISGLRNWWIGKVAPTINYWNYSGNIDEVSLWSVAKSQAQIQQLMNNAPAGSAQGLLTFWDMNREGQGAGLTVENKAASGSNYNGTTFGTTTTPVFTAGYSPAEEFLTLITPNGGENWTAGTQQNITWNSSNVSNVDLYYSTNSGIDWIFINDGIPAASGNYSWTVPSISSTNCLVKILNSYNYSVKDSSNAVFTIAGLSQQLTVNNPVGGEVWNVGTTQEINWTASNVNLVNIFYSYDNGNNWYMIADNITASLGTYLWQVPNTPSTQCKILVEDANNVNIADTTYAFTINQAIVSSLTLVSPNGGEVFNAGSTQMIYWTSTGFVSDNLLLNYTTDMGTSWTTIESGVTNSGQFEWTVPNTPSALCFVKITDLDNPTLKDSSNNRFTIAASGTTGITISSPNGGETWLVGSGQDIMWTYNHTPVGTARIEYSTNNGSTWTTIVASTSMGTGGNGSYFWEPVPNTPSANCKIKITDNGTPSKTDISDNVFAILAPSITVQSPNGGEVWLVGSQHEITWSNEGDLFYAAIEYSTNNGSTWTLINDGVENTGSYLWTIPNTPSYECLVRVYDAWGSGLSDVSNNVFRIATQFNPSITLTSPIGDEIWEVGSQHAITWNSNDVVNVKIEYSYNGGTSWNTIVSSTASDGHFLWTIPNTPSYQCQVRVSDVTNPAIASVNMVYFEIIEPSNASVSLIVPNGGQTWIAGHSYNITWNSTDITNLHIELSTNSGSTWQTLIASTPAASGSWTWNIPSDLQTKFAKIRLSDASNANVSDQSDDVFYIEIRTIAVTNPNGGENLTAGQNYNITWSSYGAIGYFKLEYSTNYGLNWNTIANYTTGSSYNWTVPNTPSQNCLVRVSDYNYPIVADTSNQTFTITAPQPYLTSVNPSSSTQGNNAWLNVYANYGTFEWGSTQVWLQQGATIINGANVNVETNNYVQAYFQFTTSHPAGYYDVKTSDPASGTLTLASGFYLNELVKSITVNSPNGGETWYTGNVRNITWSSTGVANVNIEYTLNNGTDWTMLANNIASTGTYAWTIPAVTSSACKVRVTDATDSQITDMSNNMFSIVQPSISLTKPNGGEVWTGGTQQQITWTSTGLSSYVNIQYSTNSGASWTAIANGAYNNGLYYWTIPNEPSTICLVAVSDYYNATLADTSNAVFTILQTPPSVTLTSPNGGETWLAGSAHYIYWNYINVANVKIEFTADNGATWSEIVASTPASSTSYLWTVPDTSSIQVKVRITDTETPAVTDMSNSVFTILNPVITLTAPNGGEVWTGGSVQQIAWASEDVNYVTIQYSTNNGANWSTIANGIANNNSYSWTVPNSPSTQCLVKVYDYYYSTITDQSNDVFTINQTPPSITVTSPNGGETWLYTNSQYIYWNSVSVNNVKISYSTNNGTDWTVVTASTPASNGYYYWAIPNTPSTQCKVKVEDVTNALVADESNNIFTIAVPSITVLSPNGGEVWTGLSQHQITWTSQHISNYVTLEYSLNNGSTWNTIYNGLYNSGSYNWNVPNVSSAECKIRIKNYYNASIFDVSDAVFTIEQAQPSITLNAPNGGQNLAVNTNYEISWSSVSINTINIDYSTNNGADWISVATAVNASQGYYIWTVPNTPSFECLVRVSDAENVAMTDVSNTLFGIVVPVITLTSPNGGEEWTGGEYYDITWTSNFSSNYVNIEYSTNNGISWTGVSNWENNDGMYQWFVPNTPSANCLVRVKDSYTPSLADSSNAVFTIIQTPPSVTLNYPNGYETFIVGNNHNITWSSVSVSNVKLEYSSNNGSSWTTIISSVPASQGYYNWTIPNVPSVNCLVRVSDAGNALISDVSNNKFSIVVPVITVTTPNGGEIWTGGTYQYINWTSSYTSNYVTIEYSIDNGTTWNMIVNGTYNDGNHYWLVPDNPSQLCLIRIKDYNNSSIFDVSNAIFTLLPVPPSVTVTYPNGYESLLAGATTEILWNSYNVNDVKIEYTTNNGASWEEIVSSTPASSGMYPWLVPAVTSSNCRVRITNVANTSVTDMSNNMFTITTPYITVTTPNGGQTWGVGTNKNITWNSAGVSNVRVEYSYNNGSSWTMIASNVANTGSYNWTIPNTPSTQCRVRVRDANNLTVFDVSDNTFTIPYPTVNLVAPNGGQVWAVGSTQYIYWNSTSVANVNLEYSIDGANWTSIASNIAASNGNFAWVIPNTPSTTCKVRVSNAAQASINDVSDNDFSIIVPTITVTAPNGGENWMVGSTQNITWTHVAANPYVAIQYSTNAGSTWANVDNYEYNDGSFAWVIPNTPSTDCKVRVIDYLNSTIFGESQNVFTIAAGQPSVALISPNGGESWTIGSTREIRWNSLNITNVKLEYSFNNGSSWQTITASTPAASGSYFWTVPNTPSINCKVRIRDNATPTVFDVSDAVFAIPFPSITVNTPNGGESWGVGTVKNITWSAVSVQTVNIDYSTDNGTNWINIENGVNASSGTYSWTVPNTPSTQCLVKVSHPTLSTVKDQSNNVFTILAPSVALTAPNGGETWNGLSSQYITWTSQGLSGYVKLEYTTDNGFGWNTITNAAANNGSYLWSVPNVASVDCKVRITDYNNASLNDESDDVFTINMINPSITLLTPNGGENWLVGSANYISWTSVAVNNVKIEYTTNDVDWTIISNNTPASAGSFYWVVPNTPSSTCKVRISSIANGVINDVSENYFTISQPVPTLTVTSPNGGEIWYVGDYNYITWSSNVVQNVRIDISYNNGSSWTTITSSTPAASGSYYYQVPNTPSTNCKVRIRDAANPSLVDMSNAVFRIQAPVVNNNQIYVDSIVPMTVCKGDTIKVYYTATGVYNAGNQFKLQMSGSNGNWSSLIELGSVFTEDTIGYVAGIVPLTIANDSTYKVRVLSSNLFKVGTESDTTFTVNSPEFDFYADNTLKYLPDGQIQFFYQGVDTNVTYAWDFGNNATGDEASPYNNYTEVGFYTVNLTATNAAGCATTVSKQNYIDIEQIFPTIPIAPLDSNDLSSILMVDAFTGFAVGNSGAMVATYNGGVTWSHLNTGTTVNLTNIAAIDTANIFVTGENGLIMQSVDGGLSWAIHPLATTETMNAITFHGINDGWAVGNNGAIYHFNGTVWSAEDINGTTENLKGVYIDTLTTYVFVVGSNGSIFVYDGANWGLIPTPVNVTLNDIGFANAQYGLAVGENGTILRTNDGGTSWDLAFNGISSPFTRIQIANPDTAWAVGRGGVVYQTVDGGQTFFRFSIGDTIDLNGFSYVNLYTGSKAAGASAGGRGVIVGKEGVAYRFGRDMIAVSPLVDTVLCLGSQINVEFAALGTFNPGNTFTLELSDASGDFANATVLASYSGVETNVFNVTIPSTAGSGSGYLLRVNSSDALITGESSVFGLTFVALPVVELGNDTSVCAGETVTLNSNATDEQILWSTGETSISIDVNVTDTISVTLTNFAGCQATDSKIVAVVDYPVVNLGIDTAICANANLVLDAGNAGASYVWSTSESTQTISVAVADTFIVEVTNTTGCASVDSIVVGINPVPVVSLGNDTTICEGQIVTIDAGNAGLEFLWSNNEITQAIDVTESDTYIVTVTNSFGCEGTDEKIVTVNPLPVVNLGNDTIICANTVLTLDAGNAGASYLWSTAETSQTIDVAASDTIIVIVTDANTCNATDSIVVTVNDLPVVSIDEMDTMYCVYDGAVTLSGLPVGGVFSGTGVTGTTFEPAVADSGYHTIVYTYTDTYGCENSDSVIVFVDPCVSVADVMFDENYSIYPNPVTTHAFVEFLLGKPEAISIKMIDVLGKEVMVSNEEIMPSGRHIITLNTENLTSGTYMIVLKKGNKTYQRVVVK